MRAIFSPEIGVTQRCKEKYCSWFDQEILIEKMWKTHGFLRNTIYKTVFFSTSKPGNPAMKHQTTRNYPSS
jgi:hypothetical protein